MPFLVPLPGNTKEVQSVLGHTLGTYARFGPYFLRLVAMSRLKGSSHSPNLSRKIERNLDHTGLRSCSLLNITLHSLLSLSRTHASH